MKCPYCGSHFSGSPEYCPNCRQPLSRAFTAVNREEEEQVAQARRRTGVVHVLLKVFVCLVLLAALGVGLYKLMFSVKDYRLRRLYTRGAYTPTVNRVTMEDGRAGHSFVFYGSDGDQVFIPELDRSLAICGGVARISVTDADWFEGDVSEIEAASITLTPVLVKETGGRTRLPAMTLDIDVPEAPLEIVSPADKTTNVVTSKYPLELQVVAGSKVTINGEDVTDEVDRSGLLSKDVNIFPIGNNTFTVVVDTPRHHETRREVVIRREAYEIAVELDGSVGSTSINETMAITGHVEPGASVTVETPYMEKSLLLNMETGEFSFIANLSGYGDNTVRFRAKMEGRQDAVVNLTVNYTPTLAKYSATAWAMDYTELCRLYAQWEGRVFKCDGKVVDIFRENDNMYVIMDVSKEAGVQQYVVLQNISSLKDPTIGRGYTAYADVSGRYMYNAQYYPMLIARYIDVA